jgi:nucleotide-binding universal stress UspA family protein
MTVVVGYASTPEGEAALRYGIAEAVTRGDDVVAVFSPRAEFGSDPSSVEEEQYAELQDALEQSGLPHEITRVSRRRDTAEEILEAAESRHASLVVIGVKRRSPLGKLLLGSTLQRVLLEAECPVVAVKRDVVPARADD